MLFYKCVLGTSLITQLVKNLPTMQESACDAGNPGSIPESGRSLGEGNGNPHLYSCLENPMYRGAWQATSMGLQELDTT